MNDVIVASCGKMLRCRSDWIEEASDAGDLPVLRLGSAVACGTGTTTLARKMSATKDFKRQRGTVVAVHFETTPEDRPRLIELGVGLERGGIGWFTPAELTLTDDPQEVSHAS